jgi:hypothetical protein
MSPLLSQPPVVLMLMLMPAEPGVAGAVHGAPAAMALELVMASPNQALRHAVPARIAPTWAERRQREAAGSLTMVWMPLERSAAHVPGSPLRTD